MDKQQIKFRDLGVMEYQAAWDYQEKILQENVKIKSDVYSHPSKVGADSVKYSHFPVVTSHHLLFVEHPLVYTLGKSGKKENVLLDDEGLRENDIQFFNTNRGGDITFHGPGQLVGYPILDLEKFYTDIGKYLRNLEEVIILTLGELGIKGERSAGETGVWIEPGIPGKERKICAILSYFNNIIPCGIVNKQVTSLEKELGCKLDFQEVKEKVKKNFAIVFDAVIV